MARTKWACIIAASLLLSLGMSAAQRSLLMSGAKGQEADERTDSDLHGAYARRSGSSSEGGATASSDMGISGQDMPDKARPDHRELSMVDGWDMDLHDEGCGDRPGNTHDDPGVHHEPEPIPRFPDDPYNPPLSQWQGQFMYCTPMSCTGRKDGYGPGGGGDCLGFSLLIEYPPPRTFGQSEVSKHAVHSPNESKPDGHIVPSGEPVAFPPETYGAEMSDTSGGTWEAPMMAGHE